ncbi:MAG: hypothetical protein HN872_13295 [Gammaproteobacteria bacterium]|nr:hypothetical protein [Gammaproteobacteria bacterium]
MSISKKWLHIFLHIVEGAGFGNMNQGFTIIIQDDFVKKVEAGLSYCASCSYASLC